MGNNTSTTKDIIFNLVISKSDAEKLLNDAEKQDMYLEECNDSKTNYLSRKNNSYNPNTIPVKDVNYIKTFLDTVNFSIPPRLKMDLDDVNIIQLMPTADGGMPHTRPGNIICFPNLTQIFSISTLIHELWHIHQRKYHTYWTVVFKGLGWKEWNGKLPQQLEDNYRYNPDTIDTPFWIYQDTWIPIPIFRNITHPKVGEVDIWFYNVSTGHHTRGVPPELREFFGDLNQVAFEHPREITAYMLSEPKMFENNLAFKKLIELIGRTSINLNNMSVY
jgi:hypothetical protein